MTPHLQLTTSGVSLDGLGGKTSIGSTLWSRGSCSSRRREGPTSFGEGTTLTNSSEPEASFGEDPHERHLVSCIFLYRFETLCMKQNNFLLFCMCSKHGLVFLEMMNSCSINLLHMDSYNVMLYLVLSLLAKCSNLELETRG
jgi:hypothetical protein